MHANSRALLFGLLVGLGFAKSAFALDLSDSLQLHGYGDVAATRASVDASGENSAARMTTHNLSLVGNWKASDRTSVWVQLFQSNEPGRVRLDWAYVDHQAANGLRWRAGQVRLPFGLHNEFRDVQALRPGATLPIVYDEELGIVDESFYGVSVESELRLGNSVVSYEAYAAGALLPGGERTAYGPALGARVIIEPPLPGLSLRVSAYGARLKPHGADERQPKRAAALSLRWQRDPWDLQAEAAHSLHYDHRIQTQYVQGSWQFDPRWELMVRAERVVTDTAQRHDDAFRERQWVLGLAWRLNHNVGVRAEQHWHRGHGLAVIQEWVEPGLGQPRWTSSVLSLNFQF